MRAPRPLPSGGRAIIRAKSKRLVFVATDVEDVRITTRKGVLAIVGKGEIQREVPLNALVRQVLDEWLEHRKALARDGEQALWVSERSGARGERAEPITGPFYSSSHVMSH